MRKLVLALVALIAVFSFIRDFRLGPRDGHAGATNQAKIELGTGLGQ